MRSSADMFVMATDVDGVYEAWGTPDQRRIESLTPDELRGAVVRRRVDGPEGRGRGPVRRGDRANAPRSVRSPTSSRSWRAAPAPRSSLRSDEGGRAMSAFGVHSEVGQAAQGDGPPAGPEPAAPDTVRTTTTCCSTTCCGSSGPSTSTTSSSPGCASGASRSSYLDDLLDRRAGRQRRGPRRGSSSWWRPSTPSGGRSSTRSAPCWRTSSPTSSPST